MQPLWREPESFLATHLVSRPTFSFRKFRFLQTLATRNLTAILRRHLDLLLCLGVELRDAACAPYSFLDAVPLNSLWYLVIPL